MPDIDLETLGAILREAARTEILPRWRHLSPDMVRQKTSPADLVTEADLAAERHIRARVADWLPAAVFIGEEGVAADPSLLGRLAGAELAVVVDPIDGTANFAAGLPLFAVMAAVVRRGETVGGIIYDPFADDMAVAERGGGAFMRDFAGGSRPLQVAAPDEPRELIGGASMAFLPPEPRARIYANLARLRVVSGYRCAGHDYRAFASGHLHFLFYSKLMPWDHLAGALIAAEAGAHVARLDGSAYRAGITDGNLLVAGSAAAWEALRREVFTL